jgi:hypothetical protein
MFTEEPTTTEAPAAGDSLMTLPEGTVALEAAVTVPRTRPTPPMEPVAAAWLRPTTLGTWTYCGPEETTRLTVEPTLMMVPAAGDSLITLPEATVLLEAVVTAPSARPAPVIAVVAAACGNPTTLGTLTVPGLLETTILTAEPALTVVPAAGDSLMRLPTGTVLLMAVVTVPTTRLAPVMAAVAAACVKPTTLGTATCCGPVETTMLIADPTLTVVPAAGDSLMTLPVATVLLEAVVIVPRARPAPVMAVVAAACVRPTTLGAVTVGGPVDTVMLTEEPMLTEVPEDGDSLITLPEGTVVLEAVVTNPTTRPAPVMEFVAAA